MINKNFIAVFATILSMILIMSAVSAVTPTTLFSDNFNSTNPLNYGWMGDYLESPHTQSISNDIWTSDSDDTYSGRYAVVEDDAAMMKTFSTLGYDTINFSYCRRTKWTGCSGGCDYARIGWKDGAYSGVLGEYNSGAQNWGQFTALEEFTTASSWGCQSYILSGAGNKSAITIAFYLDNGEGDNLRIDNVQVTGISLPTAPVCGNGNLEAGEQCDDGDTDNGDGCSSTCQLEQIEPECELDLDCEKGFICEGGFCVEENGEEYPLPTCSVDYLVGMNNFNLSNSVYFNKTGFYSAHGYASSNSASCFLKKIEYNRTSPNFVIGSWDPAGSSTVMNFYWKTTAYSDNTFYMEGNHTICCRPTSQPCVDGRCEEIFGDAKCTTFCIDTIAPVVTIDSIDVGCADDGKNYVSTDTWTWSWSSTDDGCAPVEDYIITLKEWNGSSWVYFDSDVVDGSIISWVNSVPMRDGYKYKLYVFGIDKAGNVGFPDDSEEIIVDLSDPVINAGNPFIYPQFQDASNPSLYWIKGAFWINETDTDNIGLNSCKITIKDNGVQTYETVVSCSGTSYNWIVEIADQYCQTDGLDTCVVTKEIEDKSCRVADMAWSLDIDKNIPTVSKEVGTPRINPWGSWISILTNGYFITDKTTITLSCNDGAGSGVQSIHYTINGGLTNTYTIPFTLPSEDGLYTINYWCVDDVNWSSQVLSEIDKVDTEAPLTSKTYSLFVYGWRNIPAFNDLKVWMRFIRPDTTITLNATDTEVGPGNRYYQILVPSKREGHEEWYCHDGDNNGTWYESAQDGMNCTPTSWDVISDCEKGWCLYTVPITVEESEHKICYYSEDLLGNIEDVKCQVFSVDGNGPVTFIINPDESYIDGNLKDACVMPLDVSLEDEKVGVESASFTLTDEGSNIVRYGNLAKYIVLPSGEERWYYPNSVDLTGLAAGEYTLNVYSKDKLNNINHTLTKITLDEGLFIPANWIKGCNVGVGGGTCTLQFTACARGVTDMDFAMTKIFDKEGGIELASLGDLNPRLVTPVDSGLVGFLNPTTAAPGYAGEITSLADLEECEVINDRVKFNVTLNFTPELIQNIGTGTYYFDWETNGYSEESCSQA